MVMGIASASRAQAGLDPQSLVGEWIGRWRSGAATGGPGPRSGREGPFAFTITRVEGGVAYGAIEVGGVTTKIRATLQGNQLKFGTDQVQTELTIERDQMRGTRQRAGTPPALLELAKSKVSSVALTSATEGPAGSAWRARSARYRGLHAPTCYSWCVTNLS
jgi:hypothetical protein